ncbi:glycosyltransferase family 4 protein [Allocoleopsis sp.]|uniref:glycosyltransferase family 4 protein n=1 Tax=Allocoleopsis sp. TaxID=3088169 RepID=UPI002FD3250E
MKILHLSESDGGGAGRATFRLHQGLQRLGVDSKILVQLKYSDDRTVFSPETTLGKFSAKLKLPERLDALPLKGYPQRDVSDFSLEWLPTGIVSKIAKLTPDVVNLHWVCHGYLPIEAIAKFKKPLVWTLHDMWAFTGGCHYSQECDRYKNSCGTCPQLGSAKSWDISRWVWQRKAKAWQNLDLTLVSPSPWLAKCARSSSLFQDLPIEVIPNGLDTQQYKPIPRQIARELLNLPQDKQLILFGAMYPNSDRRKGFYLLQQALQRLSKTEWRNQIEIAIFGASRPQEPVELGLNSHYLGRLSDEISLAVVYAAADVFVAPSTQDNLPNTVMEAIACGTPGVAFNIGGMPELIEHQHNGYLAQALDSEDLAQGIIWVLENQERYQKLCDRARQKAEQEFTLEIQARRYESLYLEKCRG